MVPPRAIGFIEHFLEPRDPNYSLKSIYGHLAVMVNRPP